MSNYIRSLRRLEQGRSRDDVADRPPAESDEATTAEDSTARPSTQSSRPAPEVAWPDVVPRPRKERRRRRPQRLVARALERFKRLPLIRGRRARAVVPDAV